MIQKRSLHRISLPKVLEDPEARIAWQDLTQKGASPDKLEELLGQAVLCQALGRSYDMLYVDGLTRNQVTNFPSQLRQIAGSIDRIRENPNLESEGFTDSEVQNLPSSLRQYANQLQGTIEFARTFMRSNPRYWDFPAIYKLKLVNYVRDTTGSPHYATVARLLNGAFTTVGMGTIVDPGSLRKLAERQAKPKANARV